MLRLSKNSGLHPTCLSIQNVKKIGDFPITAGGFGDVWKGTIGDSSELVCLKVVKVYLKSDLVKLTNEYLREAILWRQLKHPNVLPFFGIYRLEHTQQLCLISPWMEKGNLVEFLKATKREDVDHYTLVYDVTSGLAYLHSRKIVHGDLKGLNILITCSFRACIADFGLSRITDTNGLRITTSTTRPVGTARWLAPELLVGSGGPSKESDVYSYACVCYEIFTGLQPFPELANEMTVAFNVAQGKRPSRPEGAPELSDVMWALMNVCWDTNPSSRPSASHVLEKVERIAVRVSPASDWSESLFTQVWENVEYRSLSPGSPNGSQLRANRIFSDLLEATPNPWMHERTDLPHAYQHLTSTRHPHQTRHQHTESSDTTATMEMIAPSRPSPGMEQHPSMSSLAPSTMVLHDIENGNVRKEIKEKGKYRGISGWLSRWTTGGGDKDKGQGHGPKEQSQLWQPVRPEEQGGELTKLIGFLTATSSEDWALVLDVCERASASDSNAKEAVRALRREFKYGQPQAQLGAGRLWAIMLRNPTDTFIGQSTSRKFLETLEELLVSSTTNPVVKERVLDVLAAAAYASGSKKDTGFHGLWKKVKPHDKPDEGMPFDTDDPMFNPPAGGDRRSYSESLPHQQPQLHPDHHHPGRQEQNPNQPHNSLDGDLPVEANGDATENDKENSKEGKQQERDPEPSGSQVRRDSNHDHEPREKDRDNKDQSQPAGLDHDEKTCSSRKDKNRDPRDSNRERDLEPRERDKDKDRSHREHRDRDRGKDKDRERSSRKDKDRESRKRKKHRSSRERARDAQKIIPPEEDIRRLFQECIIGKGNASLLSQALVHTTLEDFLSDNTEGQSNGIIREFRVKCIASQELIAAQIPWASAGSERSRRELNAKREAEGKPIAEEEDGETTEEKLLADLLCANEELLGAFGQYEDLERVARERKAEEDSKKDVGGRRGRDEIERQLHQEELYLSSSRAAPMGARSPSPSPYPGGARVSSRSPSSSPPMPPPPVPPCIPSPGECPNSRPSSVILGGDLTSEQHAPYNHHAPPPASRGLVSPGLRIAIPAASASAGSFSSSTEDGYAGDGTWIGMKSVFDTSSDDDNEEEYKPTSEKARGKRRAVEEEDTSSVLNCQRDHWDDDEYGHLGANGSPYDDHFSVNYTDEDAGDSEGEYKPSEKAHGKQRAAIML
ncbi:hypothetical protein PM082_009112 [Marasmius tenuissimus]|nr:hypothetical protein PM082_009112 [Marasmius tenuissimus]